MRIEIYIDDASHAFQVIKPPEKFRLDTTKLNDGKHTLRFRAIDNNNEVSERLIEFAVQNGAEIAVHGIESGDTISGEIPILANAYSSRIGDEFEPIRIETPAPVPTWAWVLFLAILGWGAGYITLEVNNRANMTASVSMSSTASFNSASTTAGPNEPSSGPAWKKLGEQVYGNNCSSCHQGNGQGLPTVFPPLKNNPAVLNDDPSDHINAVLNGLSGKVIDGVSYASPMPQFGSLLSDSDVAAVINHERTQWGNSAPLITADDVAKRR